MMSLDESRLGGKKSLSSFERSLKCSLDARSNGVIDALPVGRRTAVMGAGTAPLAAPRRKESWVVGAQDD